MRKLAEYANGECGFKGFKKALEKYKQSLRNTSLLTAPDGTTDFAEQTMELDTGGWIADDFGVRKPGLLGSYEIACPHPIMPVERLKNIDTGELKVRIAFRRGDKERKAWTAILTDFDTVSNAKNIVQLSRIGISVTSGRRAQNLVDFLTDMMDRNYDIIPETKSVSKVGWHTDFSGFSPYVKDVVFDGNANFGPIFNSIRAAGDYDVWRGIAFSCRWESVAARLVLAASFASVLVGPLGCLPFFVHLWGMDSGTGKTVAQMLAVSVWGAPSPGGPLLPTFKATSVGFEIIAGFLNSLPVVIDELQLAKDHHGRINFNVYELASGSGKLRSNKTLGLVTTPTWANCFITSGETPLIGENDGAGAVNRVIEIECKATAKVIKDGHATAAMLKANYGYAGRVFVEKLIDGGMEKARQTYESYYTDCLKGDTTEKQAMAAALILTADRLASEWIWEDPHYLTVAAISEFLKSKEAVSAADRGYDYMCDWVSQNYARFSAGSTGEVYGVISEGENVAYVIRRAFNEACEAGGVNPRALLSHMKSNDQIITRGRAMTVSRRINGVRTECVAMRLPECEE